MRVSESSTKRAPALPDFSVTSPAGRFRKKQSGRPANTRNSPSRCRAPISPISPRRGCQRSSALLAADVTGFTAGMKDESAGCGTTAAQNHAADIRPSTLLRRSISASARADMDRTLPFGFSVRMSAPGPESRQTRPRSREPGHEFRRWPIEPPPLGCPATKSDPLAPVYGQDDRNALDERRSHLPAHPAFPGIPVDNRTAIADFLTHCFTFGELRPPRSDRGGFLVARSAHHRSGQVQPAQPEPPAQIPRSRAAAAGCWRHRCRASALGSMPETGLVL